ncbi:MAG: MotA/TolQ/ExbB proton channel family protein [Bacteriovoracaceae bacterium]|nr:MotA/TolQ/ExbB proton channel family protein [Bacteriovoracaceae bacterium]
MVDNLDVYNLILTSGTTIKIVLFVLLLASIISWAVIIRKYRLISVIKKHNNLFMDIYNSSTNFNEITVDSEELYLSSFRIVFVSGHEELLETKKYYIGRVAKSGKKENYHFADVSLIVSRGLQKGMGQVNILIQDKLSTIASIGAISPFLGLFGTVWGIINSFRSIASGGIGIASVAPGVAEALVTTAIGLVAAIPAVLFYNYFANENLKIIEEMEMFEKKFLNDVERSLISLAQALRPEPH